MFFNVVLAGVSCGGFPYLCEEAWMLSCELLLSADAAGECWRAAFNRAASSSTYTSQRTKGLEVSCCALAPNEAASQGQDL